MANTLTVTFETGEKILLQWARGGKLNAQLLRHEYLQHLAGYRPIGSILVNEGDVNAFLAGRPRADIGHDPNDWDRS